MSISEVSRSGQAQGAVPIVASSAAPVDSGRQKVSPSGNTPPLSGQSANKPETPPAPAPSREATKKAVAIVAELLQNHSRNLQFEVDEQSGKEIVTVLDGETGDVIRQFPSEDIVASARYIAESNADVTTGVLLDQLS